MPDTIVFQPKIELDARANLAAFVTGCRENLTIFGANLPFNEAVWDVTEALGRAGMGAKRERLIFHTLEDEDRSGKPMAEPFLSFAKAYLRYMHGLKPTKAIGFRLAALRALETALREQGDMPDPVRTDTGVLNRAAQMLGDRYSEAAAYRIGGQLEMVAAFLSENHLTIAPLRWHNYLKRPEDAVRVGKAFDDRRAAKMPSEAALDALPKVFRLAREPVDVIVSAVAALLCASPDRISEVLSLPVDCEVRQRRGKDNQDAYGLRWWPAKGAKPMIKWVVPSMADVVQEAIRRIRTITEPARRVALWYEEHPHALYLEDSLEPLRTQRFLSLMQLAMILGLKGEESARSWCRKYGVLEQDQPRAPGVRFADVERVVLALLPEGFPVANRETGLKCSDSLLVVRRNELHPRRGTCFCVIEPVTIGQIATGLGARVAHGFGSVFTRLGFTQPDGRPICVTTHQFRHYLNTLAQAGGLSQLDIAKWSGRKDVRQNAAYDHVTADQMLQKIREAVGDESQMFGPLADLPKRVPISRNEFARLVVPTAHTTDLGFCIHDYTMSPCQLHGDCIHCQDLVCVKGDLEKTQRLRLRLEEARDLLKKAEAAMQEGYAGGDRWFMHHNATVERLTQLSSILDDPKLPMGAVVQFAPSGAPQGLADLTKRIAQVSEGSISGRPPEPTSGGRRLG
jgi:hypothetical protein